MGGLFNKCPYCPCDLTRIAVNSFLIGTKFILHILLDSNAYEIMKKFKLVNRTSADGNKIICFFEEASHELGLMSIWEET